jgi:hypothetical protein
MQICNNRPVWNTRGSLGDAGRVCKGVGSNVSSVPYSS